MKAESDNIGPGASPAEAARRRVSPIQRTET